MTLSSTWLRVYWLRLRFAFERARTQIAPRALARPVRLAVALTAFGLTIAIILLGYWSSHCLLQQYDDAYITFRYAYNLASGKGLVFNVGEATDSASSFAYTLLLALGYRLGLHDLPLLATIVGVGCAAGVAAVVSLACLRRTRRPLLSLLLAVAVTTDGMISGWAISGMETLLFAFLVALAIYRMCILRRLGWFEASLIALCLLTRLEAVLLLLAWLLVAAGRVRGGSRRQRRSIVWQALGIGAVGAGFLAFKYATYGTFVPHAFSLKTITTLYEPRPRALWQVWGAMASMLLVLAIAGFWTLPRRIESAAVLLYVLASAVSVVLGPNADWARYSVHLLPLAAMLASVPLAKLTRLSPVLSLAACGLIVWQAAGSFTTLRKAFVVGAGHYRCRVQIGKSLERTLPPGTAVLSSDIGVIAYAAPSISFIDAVGLTSKDVLQARQQGRSVDSVLAARKPVVVADTCGKGCDRPEDFSAYHWLTNPGYWRTPLPGQHYLSWLKQGRVLDRCTSPDGLDFGAATFKLDMPKQPEQPGHSAQANRRPP